MADSVVYKVRDYVGAIEYVNGAVEQIRRENGYITLDKGLTDEHIILSGTEAVVVSILSCRDIKETSLDSNSFTSSTIA